MEGSFSAHSPILMHFSCFFIPFFCNFFWQEFPCIASNVTGKDNVWEGFA